MRWEYLLLRVNYSTLHQDPGLRMEGDVAVVGVQGLAQALNHLGSEEWEAVGLATETTQGAIKHVLFKRPEALATIDKVS